MNRLTLLLALALAACGDPVPTYTGTVAETRGQCWTIIGEPDAKGQRTRYAVKAEAGRRLALAAGQKVALRARVAAVQDCAAAVVLEPAEG